jgi:integrase
MNNYAITCNNLVKPMATPTLGEVADAVLSDKNLPLQKRRDLVAAVHKIGQLIGPGSLTLPANSPLISKALSDTSPAMIGLEPSSFANTKSRIRSALKLAGFDIHPGKHKNDLSPAWEQLRDQLRQPNRWAALSRLAHVASALDVDPEQISDAHMEHLLQTLEANSLHDNPYQAVRQTAKTWNACVCKIPGWRGKNLTIPSRRRKPYTLKLEEFDESLRREVDSYFKSISEPSPFSIVAAALSRPSPFAGRRSRVTRRPIAKSTMELRRFQLLQYFSALVSTGTSTAALTSLGVATQPGLVESGLTFFYELAGKRMSVQIGMIGNLLVDIVNHWLKDAERAAEIAAMLTGVPRPQVMSRKVEGLLRQFDDPRNRGALLKLPLELAKKARAMLESKPAKAARLFETALVIQMFLLCPIRIGNLVTLDIEKHFKRSRPGPKGMVHLVIPAEDVKNHLPLEFEVPTPLMRMSDEHLEKFRVHLPGAESRWLFPRKGGKRVCYKVMGRQLATAIFRHTGIRMTAHMFRHFGAETFLDLVPAGHEVMRQTLGHTSLDMLRRFYARRNMPKAARIFAENILKLQDQSRATQGRSVKGSE